MALTVLSPPAAGAAAGRADLGGLTVGVPTNWFFDVVSSDVAAGTHAAIEIMAAARAAVQEVALPHASLADTVSWIIILAELGSLHADNLDRFAEYGSGQTRQWLSAAQFVQARDYLKAVRLRPVIQRDLAEAFAVVDVLVVPGMPTTAPKLGQDGFTLDGRAYP